jgi:hypothetical protein
MAASPRAVGPAFAAARRAAWEALHAEGTPSQLADGLEAAADAVPTSDAGLGAVSALYAAYRSALVVVASLYRWDAAVREAEPDFIRYLMGARRNAELAAGALNEGDELHESLRRLLVDASALESPDEIDDLRVRLTRIALPLDTINEPRPARRRPSDSMEPPPEPRAVLILRVGDHPVTGPILVDAGRAYDLEVEARVLDWPPSADSLNVRFLSRWQGTAAHVSDVTLTRTGDGEGGVWRAVAPSGLVVRATPAERDKPLLFTAEATLQGEESRPIEVLGYSELALHVYDPALDYVTGSNVIDRRVYEVLVDVKGSGAREHEGRAFSDLFRVLANEAQIIVANRLFRSGEHVLEANFQQELLERVQSRLGAANVRTGTEVGGGEMDIVYLDTITAELKVERDTPATVDRAPSYLGQPAHYAAAAGEQLSILCILDVSPKSAPPGNLANGIHLLRPRLLDLDAPEYPSLVGVIIVSGGLPLPSEWSGRRIDTT